MFLPRNGNHVKKIKVDVPDDDSIWGMCGECKNQCNVNGKCDVCYAYRNPKYNNCLSLTEWKKK